MSKAKSTKQVILAVGYLRKSTKGKRGNDQKQEKSLSQQRTEIRKLAEGRFDIIAWFEDEGISGWKREGERPDFQRMIEQVKELGAQAIICDNIDRFSRASYDDVQEDARALRKAGVRWIVTVSHGDYDLQAGQRNDIGGIITFAAAVWAAHESSRQLARRITLARRNAAIEGKRTGGKAPYGWDKDGKHGLKHGPKRQVAIVNWIFDQFAIKGATLPGIAEQLNTVKKEPGPTGGVWRVCTLRHLIRKRLYIGDFVYNQKRNGQFFTLDEKGEATDVAELNGARGKVFVVPGRYPPMVSKAVFNKAQRRLARTTPPEGKEVRKGKYALSGILVCDKCGERLHATRMDNSIVYRCGTSNQKGKSACKPWMVREDRILPFVLRLLGEEITSLEKLCSGPPEELARPNKKRKEQTAHLNQQVAKLEASIDVARKSMYETDPDDTELRAEIDQDIRGMRQELNELRGELDTTPTDSKGFWVKHRFTGERDFIANPYTREQLDALTAWHEEFEKRAVSVPVSADVNFAYAMGLMQDPFCEESAVLIEPRAVNEMLHELGTRVTLRWKTVDSGEERPYTTRAKDTKKRKTVYKPRLRHVLVGGRFQLGQKSGSLPRYVTATPANRENRRRRAASRRRRFR